MLGEDRTFICESFTNRLRTDCRTAEFVQRLKPVIVVVRKSKISEPVRKSNSPFVQCTGVSTPDGMGDKDRRTSISQELATYDSGNRKCQCLAFSLHCTQEYLTTSRAVPYINQFD